MKKKLSKVKNRNIKLKYVIYNSFFDEDKTIAKETLKYLENKIKNDFEDSSFLVM